MRESGRQIRASHAHYLYPSLCYIIETKFPIYLKCSPLGLRNINCIAICNCGKYILRGLYIFLAYSAGFYLIVTGTFNISPPLRQYFHVALKELSQGHALTRQRKKKKRTGPFMDTPIIQKNARPPHFNDFVFHLFHEGWKRNLLI